MIVKYTGMFEQVEIAETGQWAERGTSLEVPDDVAARLVLAEDWDRVDTGPLEDRTKSELLVRAEQHGIEGRTSMSKDELITAIREVS